MARDNAMELPDTSVMIADPWVRSQLADTHILLDFKLFDRALREYVRKNKDAIYHFDFYGIKNEDEAFDMGVEEYFESDNFCFLEWATLIPSYLPSERLHIHLQIGQDNKRIIHVQLM